MAESLSILAGAIFCAVFGFALWIWHKRETRRRNREDEARWARMRRDDDES